MSRSGVSMLGMECIFLGGVVGAGGNRARLMALTSLFQISGSVSESRCLCLSESVFCCSCICDFNALFFMHRFSAVRVLLFMPHLLSLGNGLHHLVPLCSAITVVMPFAGNERGLGPCNCLTPR